MGRGFEVRPSIGRRSSGDRSDESFWAFLLTVKRDTQKERTTKSRKSWGAKAVRVGATGSPRAHRCFAVGHESFWAFLLTVKRDTQTEGANNQISEKLGS